MSSSYPPPPPGDSGGQFGQGQPGQGQFGSQPGQYGAQPGQYGSQPGQYGGAPVAPKNGFGLTALILGILGILFSWTGIGGIILGIAAIVLGILGRKRAKRGEATNGGVALGGIITGAIALVLGIVMIAFSAWLFSQLGFGDLQQCLEQAAGDPVATEQCNTQYQQELEEQFGQ